MAQRNLLKQHERERRFLPRTNQFSIVRNYTLAIEDASFSSGRACRPLYDPIGRLLLV